MQLVGYECRMWMPLDLSPSHNWLVNNLVPVSSRTEPENSQAAYSSCLLSSHFCPLHKRWGGCLCKHSLTEAAILHVTASSCPCSSESLLIYFLEREGRGRVGSGQRAGAADKKATEHSCLGVCQQ